MFVCCECCVLSGRGLCDGLVTRSEESYRLWRVVVCDQETSYARRLWPARGLQNTNPQWVVAPVKKKPGRSFTLFAINFIWAGPDSNPSFRGKKMAANHLTHGVVFEDTSSSD
jgi:hypothetical protein